MAGFPAAKEANFFAFYQLNVEEKVIFENSLRRKLRLETGISTVFSDFETATPAPRKLQIGAGKFLDKLLCISAEKLLIWRHSPLFCTQLYGKDPTNQPFLRCFHRLYRSGTVDGPIYRPVVARPKRTGKQGKPVYRGKRPHVHKKSRCISTDFDMACLCFSCCRGSLQLQYY